jgi:signal transduction histidine kinase
MATQQDERIAAEQAALRRVATLVARAAAPEAVFATVAAEVGRLLEVDFAHVSRYDQDGAATLVGTWNSAGETVPVPEETRWSLGGSNVTTGEFQTGRPERINRYDEATGVGADIGREWGLRSAVCVPISVEGRLWGFMLVAYRHEQLLPADTEARLAGFTELVATAVANAQARTELRGFADEQAALRRVATLVACGATPEEVLAAVTVEAGRLLGVDLAAMGRYDPDGAGCWVSTAVAAWSSTGTAFPVGNRARLGGRNVSTLVFETSRPVRIDDYTDASGPSADLGREWGFGAAVGVPISVERRLWGVVVVGSVREPLPAGTEARLVGFTELVATAIANAEVQVALAASRARIVAAADAARRRIERDLHDGVQQHLVFLGVQIRTAQAALPPGAGEAAAELDAVADGLTSVLEELREIARGIHPAALTEGGLRPALKALARRSPVPVRLDVRVNGRLPEPIELAGYYFVAEALTNAAKHAHASVVDVGAAASEGVLRIEVGDDGRGGAHAADGSGLVGLTDRMEALGGRLTLHSPPGAGTTLQVALPLNVPPEPGLLTAGTGPPDGTRPGHSVKPEHPRNR